MTVIVIAIVIVIENSSPAVAAARRLILMGNVLPILHTCRNLRSQAHGTHMKLLGGGGGYIGEYIEIHSLKRLYRGFYRGLL